MSTTPPTNPPPAFSPAFLLRRTHLLSSISDSLENVLSQINGLNRGLESIIEIGNEFASVEALWSSFEGAMGDLGREEMKEEVGEGQEPEGKEADRENAGGNGEDEGEKHG